MKRKFRLTKSNDFKRVRRNGKSYAHPLIVLIVDSHEDAGNSRFGISAGRSVGIAVDRNRAKRMLREALKNLIPEIQDGWDIILLARRPLPGSSLPEVQIALKHLLTRAGLMKDTNET